MEIVNKKISNGEGIKLKEIIGSDWRWVYTYTNPLKFLIAVVVRKKDNQLLTIPTSVKSCESLKDQNSLRALIVQWVIDYEVEERRPLFSEFAKPVKSLEDWQKEPRYYRLFFADEQYDLKNFGDKLISEKIFGAPRWRIIYKSENPKIPPRSTVGGPVSGFVLVKRDDGVTLNILYAIQKEGDSINNQIITNIKFFEEKNKNRR